MGYHRSPKTEFKKGSPSAFKGRNHSAETTHRISSALKGVPWSEARRRAQKVRTRPVIKNDREYHPLWHEIRRIVYKRDDWTCQECGAHCHNNIKIQCHHIDYDINNNDLSNLITLCSSCHMKTNFKRLDWITHYSKRREN